jgi:hypothetical protein
LLKIHDAARHAFAMVEAREGPGARCLTVRGGGGTSVAEVLLQDRTVAVRDGGGAPSADETAHRVCRIPPSGLAGKDAGAAGR